MRAKKSVKNLAVSLISQVLIIGMGIVLPRIILLTYGSEVNGLLSTLSQIFVYLNLLEAGVGGASLQALYKTISNQNNADTNAILAATSKYYKKSGIYYLIAILLLALVYPLVLPTSIDYSTSFLMIIVLGIPSVVNYYYFSTIKLLLVSEGKNYVNITIATIISMIGSTLKIVLIYLGFGILLVQAVVLVLMLVQIAIYYFYIHKRYKWINLSVKPDLKAVEQKGSVLIHQISSLIFTNTDILIISIFLGLKQTSVYALYNMIFTFIDYLIESINGSVVFVLGHNYHQDKNRFTRLFNLYETYFVAIVYGLLFIAWFTILPFMKLYTAGVTDILYVDAKLALLFVIVKILNFSRSPSNHINSIAGLFRETQNRSIIESVINLVCSLVLVNYFGIYGVLFGTIIALAYRVVDLIVFTSRNILNQSFYKRFFNLLFNTYLFVQLWLILKTYNIAINGYLDLLKYGLIIAIIVLPAFILLNTIVNYKATSIARDFVVQAYRTRRSRISKDHDSRILIVSDTLVVGGVEKMLINLARHLDAKHGQVSLLLLYNSNNWEGMIPDHVRVKYIFKKKPSRKMMRFLYYFCRYAPPRLIHFLFIRGQYAVEIAFNHFIIQQFARSFNAPKRIGWIHEDIFYDPINPEYAKSRKGRLGNRITVAMYNNLSTIVCVSHHARASFCARWGYEDKTKVIYNGLDIQAIVELARENKTSQRLPFANREVRLVSVGRIVKEKGFDDLIEVVSLLKQRRIPCRLLIVGDGVYRQALELKIAEHGLTEAIKIAGFTSNPYRHIEDSDIYVTFSQQEGFGLTTIEAMILGKPVVSYANRGAMEILGDNEYGIVVFDRVSMADQIQDIYENRDRYQVLQEVGYERAKSFDISQFNHQVDELIRS